MKVGIYAPWASGDMILATMVLKYKELFWPNSQIVWFIRPKAPSDHHTASGDIVAHNPFIDEVRMSEEDFTKVIKLRVGHRTNEHGHPLIVPKHLAGQMTSVKAELGSFRDLDLCYFPAPWACCDKLSEPYLQTTSRYVFDYPESPHPCLYFSKDEDEKASIFMASLPFKYNIMMETKCGSNQSAWDQNTTKDVMATCRVVLGDCNFIFASNGVDVPQDRGVVNCSEFTIRQCVPVYNRCHLFLGTASAISMATCGWSSNPTVKRIDYTNSPFIASKPIAMGETLLVSNHGDLLSSLGNFLRQIR